MDQYKKILTWRMIFLSVLELFIILVLQYNVFWATAEMKQSTIFEFQSGAATSLGVLGFILIMRYRNALNHENKLKILYNKEHDERMKAIRAKAGLPILLLTSIAMMAAGIIGGYFNITIFYVLIITAACQMLLAGIVKLIYMKKL